MNDVELAQWLCCEQNWNNPPAHYNIEHYEHRSIWWNYIEDEEKNAWLLTARQLSQRFALFHPQPEVEVQKKISFLFKIYKEDWENRIMWSPGKLKTILKSHFLKDGEGK